MKIILDTNFLISSINFKVDVFSELRGNDIFTLDNVIEELKKISTGKGKDSISARIALKLIKRKGLKILKSKEKETDLSLLNYGKRGYVIATQDLNLKNKLKKIRAKFIYIRQKKYVMIE
jgi:rRNA-processing protein FCF1